MQQRYHALVHPFLSYGLSIRGATYPTYIFKRLKSLKKSFLKGIPPTFYRIEP